LDVIFNEDKNRTRKDNSAENFSVVRRIALNALKKLLAKMSLNRKRRKRHYDENFLADVLFWCFNFSCYNHQGVIYHERHIRVSKLRCVKKLDISLHR